MEMLTGKPSLCHLGTLRWPEKKRERERDRSIATFGGFVLYSVTLVRLGMPLRPNMNTACWARLSVHLLSKLAMP